MNAFSEIKSLEDFFLQANVRGQDATYCCVVQGYSNEIGVFLGKYYKEAKNCGCIIEGPLKNPDEKNIQFFYEKLGETFEDNREFMKASIQKWMPGIALPRKERLSVALESLFINMKMIGYFMLGLN